MKKALVLVVATLSLSACGSSLSDRQIADKVADHSACSDLAKYAESNSPQVKELMCGSGELATKTLTFCKASKGYGGSDVDTAFYYQDENGSPIGIRVDGNDHKVADVFHTDREYGYCR